MEHLTEHVATADPTAVAKKDRRGAERETVALPFARRQKTRQRLELSSGETLALMLPRGTVIRGGDWVRSEAGRVVVITAAPERVSTVCCDEAEALARIAYHLGNRHVWVQVGPGWLRYLSDHVLDAMVRGLGGEPHTELAPFEPESGAYGGNAHRHTHDH